MSLINKITHLSGSTTNKDTERASTQVSELIAVVVVLPNDVDGLTRRPGGSGNGLGELHEKACKHRHTPL